MVQLLEQDNITELDEINGTNSKPKWMFEIFHGEHVHGMRQTNSTDKQLDKEVGCTDGEAQRIEMMGGEQVIKVTFSGLE